MKNIILIAIFIISLTCNAQEYPLTTTEVPSNAYIKDLNNQLPAFDGSWKGTWKNKTFLVNFKKVKYYFTHLQNNPYYQDILIGKFQVKDANGNILFDNLNIPDNQAKIEGSRMFTNGTYSLSYLDSDLCDKMGFIRIAFTNSTKTQMILKYSEVSDLIEPSCFFYGKPGDQRPEPIPKEIILTKQ
ncbi:DUF6705 family protein [Chryseobacterium sp. Chry.R1]|uniref:DUF6705 family protein n=1 Tax=Chryseobacterium sp. Chry.R1 TaxID=3139392 RepID=UPI0031F736E4